MKVTPRLSSDCVGNTTIMSPGPGAGSDRPRGAGPPALTCPSPSSVLEDSLLRVPMLRTATQYILPSVLVLFVSCGPAFQIRQPLGYGVMPPGET